VISRLVAVVLLAASLVTADAAVEAAGAPDGRLLSAASATTERDDGETETTALDNPFLPEDANLGDCISALPRPECGSEARGGWRQGLVFGAVVAGMAVIGWRLFVNVRRRDGSHPG
jgi:hypothetical protein